MVAHDCHAITLHVLVGNDTATGFYSKMQFHVQERIARYYFIDGQFQDAYLMRRALAAPAGSGLDVPWLARWARQLLMDVDPFCGVLGG